MNCHTRIPVTDASSIGEARRAAAVAAQTAGLTETDAGRLAIVTTELATNLVRHATPSDRAVLVGCDTGVVEVLAVDLGPGIANLARSFEDGYSTAGTAGNGLGAVRRQSDDFDIHTSSTGTVIWSLVRTPGGQETARPPATFRITGVSLPAVGELVCGDAWAHARSEGNANVAILVADGLGHGPAAGEASAAARALFLKGAFNDAIALFDAMHAALGSTRGAAVAVARIDAAGRQVSYTGVGNIAGTLIAADGSTRGLFSHNGTVGHQMRKAQVFTYPWEPGSTLVMHSDGLQTRWDLSKYPGLTRRRPGVIAGVLARDFRRGRDDATVVVINN